ncbi:MAG: CDGSH iron-sulfur domain-containing protein [Gemmatimonadota bacterium]
MPLKIIVRENGPFAVDLSTGDLQLVDHLGNTIPLPAPKPGKTTISLCRCGASANKPFCDSTHKKIEWKGANPTGIESTPSSEPPRPA